MIDSGVISVDKPAGWTSHDIVAKIRGLLKTQKVGHLGTLDPEATGVLPVCFGSGTKLVPYLVHLEKEYDAVLRLGIETDTEDASGKVLSTQSIPDDVAEKLPDVLESFIGAYTQIPPMYSAIKMGGVPLYKIARSGTSVARPSRVVEIRTIRLHRITHSDVLFNVVCGSGTYIRTLCADIGRRLGVGGHLLSLRRLRVGFFHLERSVAMERFKSDWQAASYSMNEALLHLPAIRIRDTAKSKLVYGVYIGASDVAEWGDFTEGTFLRVIDSKDNLLAVVRPPADSTQMVQKQGLHFKTERVVVT